MECGQCCEHGQNVPRRNGIQPVAQSMECKKGDGHVAHVREHQFGTNHYSELGCQCVSNHGLHVQGQPSGHKRLHREYARDEEFAGHVSHVRELRGVQPGVFLHGHERGDKHVVFVQ